MRINQVDHKSILFWTWKPVLRCRLRRAHLARETPRGSGFWDGEGMGGMEGGFQVSKRDQKGESKKQEDCAITALFVYMYIMIACNCLNDCQSVYVRMIIF